MVTPAAQQPNSDQNTIPNPALQPAQPAQTEQQQFNRDYGYQQQQRPKRFYKSVWFWVVAAITGLLVCGICGGTLFVGTNSVFPEMTKSASNSTATVNAVNKLYDNVRATQTQMAASPTVNPTNTPTATPTMTQVPSTPILANVQAVIASPTQNAPVSALQPVQDSARGENTVAQVSTPTREFVIADAVYVPAGCLYYLPDTLEGVNAIVVHGLPIGNAQEYARSLMSSYGITGNPQRGCNFPANSNQAETLFTETVLLNQGMNWGNRISEFVVIYGINVNVQGLPTSVPGFSAMSVNNMTILCEDMFPQANFIIQPNEEWVVPECMDQLTVSIHWGVDAGTEMLYAISVREKRAKDFGPSADGGQPFYVAGRETNAPTKDWTIATYTLKTGDVISSGEKATTLHYGVDSWPNK